MRSYLQWIDERKFWVREAWNSEKGEMEGEGNLTLFPTQRRILGHALTIDEKGHLPYETVLYSCPKKSGKTAIEASIGCWYAEEARPGTEIYVIANTQEQAEGRVMRDIKFHFEKRNQALPSKYRCKITLYRIDFPNGTFIQCLAQSFKSVAGSRHALTLWDELWGAVNELDRRTWDELTPIPTVTNSLRFVATYAGFENESELLWDLYIRSVGKDENEKGTAEPVPELDDIRTDDHPACWQNGKNFAYWDHEPRMPWQTDEYYETQLQTERPSSYLRFHLNRWVTSQEEFIPIEWWDAATKSYIASAEMWPEHPLRGRPITVAVDAGLKRDTTALVAVAFDQTNAKIGVVHHKIWTPTKDEQVDLEQTVELELMKLREKYHIVSVVYDPTHLIQTMLKLQRRGLPTQEFPQTVANMTLASQLLYDILKNGNLDAYPADDLRKHIQMAVAENNSRGFRIVKGKISKRHHIDGAIALAMAAWTAVQLGGGELTSPIRIRNPFLEDYGYVEMDNEQDIPMELRDND